MEDKRTHSRVYYHASIELETSDDAKMGGELVNISTGGAFVKISTPPSFGTKVRLIIDLPSVPDRCKIPCIVRWIKQDSGAGLQFEQLRPIEVWAINRLKRTVNATKNGD
ncbi:MAG: PilZ domain-containing protein [Myxococcota bacterium]|nr:PilZ domain-containing protein [Myxococcota bacterium]